MKFKKEEAYKDLVAKLTANGEALNLTERSINMDLENLIPLIANDEMELSDFISKVLPFFKTSDGNIRHDVSEKLKEALAKEDEKRKKGKGENKNEGNGEKSDLEKRIEALEAENQKFSTEKKLGEKRNAIASKLKEKNIDNDKWINAMLSKISLNEETDIDKEADDLETLYNDLASYHDNQTPKGEPSGTGENRLSDTIKAAADYVKSSGLA